MRKILRVYEKSCIPIRKKSQLLYTIYRKWLLISEPIKWKVYEVCPLNFSLVWQIMIDQEVVHDQAQSGSAVGQLWSTVRRVYRKEKSAWRPRQIMIDRWWIMIDTIKLNHDRQLVNYDRPFVGYIGRKNRHGDQGKLWSTDGKLWSTKKVVL